MSQALFYVATQRLTLTKRLAVYLMVYDYNLVFEAGKWEVTADGVIGVTTIATTSTVIIPWHAIAYLEQE